MLHSKKEIVEKLFEVYVLLFIFFQIFSAVSVIIIRGSLAALFASQMYFTMFKIFHGKVRYNR